MSASPRWDTTFPYPQARSASKRASSRFEADDVAGFVEKILSLKGE